MPLLAHDASEDKSLLNIKAETVEICKCFLWGNQSLKIFNFYQLDDLTFVLEREERKHGCWIFEAVFVDYFRIILAEHEISIDIKLKMTDVYMSATIDTPPLYFLPVLFMISKNQLLLILNSENFICEHYSLIKSSINIFICNSVHDTMDGFLFDKFVAENVVKICNIHKTSLFNGKEIVVAVNFDCSSVLMSP